MALLRSICVFALVASSVACKRSDAVTKDPPVAPVASASAPATAPIPSGAPLSRIVPPARPGPRKPCPLTIEPGVALGPVLLGETIADVEAAGFTVTKKSTTHAEVALAGGSTLNVTLCEGKIIDIWIDDLRKAPACVEFNGATIASTIPREDLEKTLGGCTATEPRIGGAFERCQDGGVYVGHGMGTFIQLRVRPKSLPFDNACEIATDDGSPIALSAAEKVSMLKKALNLPELGRYWHVDKPGRDPLRIVKTPLVPQQSFMMFGSPVVWIDEADAKKGTAFMRITGLTATKTKATLTFEYPIEGVVATASFAHVTGLNDWRLERGEVRER